MQPRPALLGERARNIRRRIIGMNPLGSIVHEVLRAAAEPERMGISAHVLNIPSIKPLERKGLTEAITRTGHIVKLGEHSVHGGVGSLVAEIMVKEGIRAHLTRPGVPEGEFAKAGPRQDIRAYHEFDWQGIVDASKKLMDRPA